jgi:hypothetical protein
MRVARAAPARRHPIATPATAPPDSPFLVIVDCVGKAVLEFDPLLATENVLNKVGVLNEVTDVAAVASELLGRTTEPFGSTRVAGGVAREVAGEVARDVDAALSSGVLA